MDHFERLLLAQRRIANILRTHKLAIARTLEQKISDSGPSNQRIEPHLLTSARQILEKDGSVLKLVRNHVPWYHLSGASREVLDNRLVELEPIHQALQEQQFTMRVGQTLEIAVFKALRQQQEMTFLGDFRDLDDHDDSTLYRKEDPPSAISGRRLSTNEKLDFFVIDRQRLCGGIEAKNIREWLYPDRKEVRSFLRKCCQLDVVPILIGRRIPFVTFRVLNPCGVIIHQMYNQLFPLSGGDLAEKAKAKHLLGYHDIRVGNEPDERLHTFIQKNLPNLLFAARQSFAKFKDLLELYAGEEMPYKEFAARVREAATRAP